MYVVACPISPEVRLPWAHYGPLLTRSRAFLFRTVLGDSMAPRPEILAPQFTAQWCAVASCGISWASFRQVFSPEIPWVPPAPEFPRIFQNLPYLSEIFQNCLKKTNSNILIIPRVSSRIITYLYANKQRSSEDSMIRNAPSTASLLALAHLVPQWPCITTEQPKKKHTRNCQTLSDYLCSTKQTCTDQKTSKNHEYPGLSVGWQARNPKLHGNRPNEVLLLLQRTLPVPEHRSYKKNKQRILIDSL